mgnify:CR=1 FL=1
MIVFFGIFSKSCVVNVLARIVAAVNEMVRAVNTLMQITNLVNKTVRFDNVSLQVTSHFF